MSLTDNLPSDYTIMQNSLFDDRKIIAVSTGFQRFYNNPANGGLTRFMFGNEAFEGDVIRGSKTTALLVPRGISGKIIEEEEERQNEFSSFKRTFPLGRKIGNIHANQILKRVPGEQPFNPLTREQRLTVLASSMHESHIRQQIVLFEILASLMTLTGKMPAILGTVDPDLIYDYRRNPTHIFAAPEFWDDLVDGDPLADLDVACDLIQINGKVMADMAVMGEEAMDAYLKHPKVKDWHDNRRMELGVVSDKLAVPESIAHFMGDGGFQLRGAVTTPKGRKLFLFSYLDHYELPKGSPTKFMPVDSVLVASSRARNDRFFGPSEFFPPTSGEAQWMMERFGFDGSSVPLPEAVPPGNLITPEMFHFNSYPSEDGKTIRVVTETAPVFGDAQVDGKSTITATIS